jgi:hypothetical protein
MNILRAVSEQLHLFTSPERGAGHTVSVVPSLSAFGEPETPHRSSISLETEIPHCCFYCSWCAAPVLLPHESLGLPFGGPLIRKIEARSIGTVCLSCGRVGTYSLFRGSPGYNTRHKFVASRPLGSTVLLDWLACQETTCVFPLPFFVTFDVNFSEANVKELAARWSWEDLMCSVGHLIYAPKWIIEPGPHRGSLDITQMAIKLPR